ncbi:mechanosensitive ion channel protein MscS [Candidatus Acidianus copahuensis]|uniref:Mechanosensitive ion channel protein MscS n=1 Tax=Candidatus Acidianus copahuensis TaxID=1160895 RepID=A0A031LM03_9CREN|nr:mechanosensitive ion channel protein MscS [Candidatus Acidianus copahuensis]
MNKALGFIVLLIVILISAAAIVYILSPILKLPVSFTLIIYSILILIGGIILTNLVSKLIKNEISRILGQTASGTLNLGLKTIGYIVTIIAAMSILKIGITSILFGGTVTGIIAGLALETPLSNVFSGIFLMLSRPFSIGDRVTISTWQYGLLAPTYPPKFSSNDFLIPGYTGKIIDISLMYTSLLTDENVLLKIPSSIMIQAAIFVHNEEYRLVRTKYEIPKTIDPDEAIQEIKLSLKGLNFLIGEPSIKVLDTSLTTYVIAIDAYCKGQYEEPPRSEIIKNVIKTVNKISDEKVKT